MASEDAITVARLNGAATRHVNDRTPHDVAVDELRAIATQHRRGVGPKLRVDLLSEAAGGHLGSHRSNPTHWVGPAAAQLLLDAGADPEDAERWADVVVDRLRTATRPGIGNPG